MPRNMSFMLTTEQIRNRTKTVTRRLGWWNLKPGDVVNACVKCRGLKKGETVERICQIRIVSTRKETLTQMLECKKYGQAEVVAEGFPEMTADEFVAMFKTHNKCPFWQTVNRIEFEYEDA